MIVKDFENKPEYFLVQVDHEVESILEYIGQKELIGAYDYLLVKLDESQADYESIYGIEGIPYLDKDVDKLL